jgi:hypothetical protein
LQKLQDVDDEAEAKKKGFLKENKFKTLNFDFVLVKEGEEGKK